MNFTYLELATLKFAAQKLLEAVHQIEAVNIKTGGNPVLVPHEYLDSLLDDVDSAAKTIMHVTAINGMIMRNLFPLILIVIVINAVLAFMLYSVS